MSAIKKAVKWLNKKTTYVGPIALEHPEGYAYFAAYVFKLKRDVKRNVWYVVKMGLDNNPEYVKRICNY